MKKWNYKCSTNTIWTSFDYGTVEAPTQEEALIKAKEELSYNLKKCNDTLDHCDITKGFRVKFDLSQIELSEVKQTFKVCSSNGEITVDKENGICIKYNCNEDIADIIIFDIKENEKYHNRKIEGGDELDILDFGYWYKDGDIIKYEEPAHDWRKEIIERNQNQ